MEEWGPFGGEVFLETSSDRYSRLDGCPGFLAVASFNCQPDSQEAGRTPAAPGQSSRSGLWFSMGKGRNGPIAGPSPGLGLPGSAGVREVWLHGWLLIILGSTLLLATGISFIGPTQGDTGSPII